MTVTYDLTRDDYIDFNMYHIAHSPFFKRNRVGVNLILGMGLALSSVHSYLTHPQTGMRIYIVCMTILSLILISKFYDWSTRRRMNKILDESKEISSTRQQTLTLKPEGLYIEDDKASSTVKWNGIEKVEASTSHIFLYTGAVNAIIIPHRAFESVAEREKFVETVMHYRENAAGISAVLA